MADVSKLVSGSIVADYTLATLKRKYYLLPLLDGEEEYEIPKPDGWTGLGRKFVRDKTYHGFVFEGAEDTSIRLHELEGASYILGFYNIYGTDFRIRFQEKVTSGSTTVVEWDGIIDLNKLKVYKTDDSYYIECGVVRNGIEDIIKPRFDTKVNLTGNKTIDETTITPPTKDIISIHSQAVTYNYLNEKKDIQIRANQSLLSNVSTYYIKMDTQNPSIDNIEESYKNDLGVFETFDTSKLFYTKVSGNFSFEISIDFSFSLTLERRLITTPIDIGDWTMDYYIKINDVEYPLAKVDGITYSGTENDQSLASLNFKFTYNNSHYVNGYSSIYLYGKFVFNPSRNNWKGSSWTLTNLSSSVKVDADTTTVSSKTYCYTPKKALTHILKSISDDKIILDSDYYDNCGDKLSLTNGFLLRTADFLSQDDVEDSKYPIMSFKDIITSLNAIHGVGFGYELSSLGQDVLKIEKYDYFYGDEEVIDITDFVIPNTYSEEVASDLIYNEIVIGYNKFPTDNNYGLDEFNTSHTIQTPIKYHVNSFERRSPFIASGYLIEYVRRQAYKTGETKASTDYDEDIFVICSNKSESQTALNDVSANFRVPFQLYVDDLGFTVDIDPSNMMQIQGGNVIQAGSIISITGSVFNNKTFTVTSVIDLSSVGQGIYGIYVNETVVFEENAIIDVSFVSLPYISEKDENFNILEGTLDYITGDYAAQAPIGDLGHILHVDEAMLARRRYPYLVADAKRTAALREANPVPAGNIICGLSWKSGNPKAGADRSIALSDLRAVLQVPGVTFVNLQYGDVAADIDSVREQLGADVRCIEGVDVYGDMDGLLALMHLCDTVITIDNLTAHLAGAIGKPSCVLVPIGGGQHWYWGGESPSLWYPSLDLIYQKKIGDWAVPEAAAAARLARIARGEPAAST